MQSCPNCSKVFDGNYCTNCGQKYLITPYSFRNVLLWLTDVFDFNRGFFITLYHLVVKPSYVVSTYLRGNTKVYVSPFKYFLLVLTILILVGSLSSGSLGLEPSEEYQTYFAFFLFVIFFWLVNLLFFRNYGFNPVESLLTVIYESTEFILLIPLCLIISRIFFETGLVTEKAKNLLLVFTYGTLILVYHLWFTINIFKGNNFIVFLKALLTFFLAFTLLGFIAAQLGQ
ncbi:MAG: DUF3667 domain-containing protein [Bacteroidota bacterium]|jgi:hypothetical protein